MSTVWPRSAHNWENIEALFDQTLAPIGRHEFLRDYYGKSYLRVEGTPGKFAGLLSWDELNFLLDHQDLKPPKLRLYRAGKELSPETYCDTGSEDMSLNPVALAMRLDEGATLIVNQISNMLPRVRLLAEAYRDALDTRTGINLYAGWRRTRGFDLHWDSHDTVILQVQGRKDWKVYRPTRLHPVTKDPIAAEPPTEPPVWEGTLRDGDLLYMPRGWWHIASAPDEPSLHLTIGLYNPTGVDFLKWAAARAMGSEVVRADISTVSSGNDFTVYAERLRGELSSFLTEENVQAFLSEWRSDSRVRAPAQLPDSVTRASKPATPDTKIRLAISRGIAVRRATEGVQLRIRGKSWGCTEEVAKAMLLLNDEGIHTLRELENQTGSAEAKKLLMRLVGQLSVAGVVSLEPL